MADSLVIDGGTDLTDAFHHLEVSDVATNPAGSAGLSVYLWLFIKDSYSWSV